MEDGIRADRPIAAYLAECDAIRARRRAAPPTPREQLEADLQACRIRHFGSGDDGINTPADLWRWIVDEIDRLEGRATQATVMVRRELGRWIPRVDNFGNCLVSTYGHLHRLDLPGAPLPPYAEAIDEHDARDLLWRIANGIKRHEAESRPRVDASPGTKSGKPKRSMRTRSSRDGCSHDRIPHW